MTKREYLFGGREGCSNHNCIIKERHGAGTNGSCKCLIEMSRGQLMILDSRLRVFLEREI